MAEKVLVNAEWDIKGAVDLFNLAKRDDELKDMFQLKDEYKIDESGKSICLLGQVRKHTTNFPWLNPSINAVNLPYRKC